MKLEEILPKSKIVISVTNGTDLQARFISKVMKNNGDSLLVIPFRHKGQRVSFAGKQIKITLEARDINGLLWNFKGCRIMLVKKNGLDYHKIFCPMVNGIENKRGGRRFYSWDSIMVEFEGLSGPVLCHLKDIGISGLSIALDLKKDVKVKDGEKLICNVKDKDGIDMKIETMVVRHEPIDKYMILGCKIENPPNRYIAYVKYLEKKNTVIDVEF